MRPPSLALLFLVTKGRGSRPEPGTWDPEAQPAVVFWVHQGAFPLSLRRQLRYLVLME